MVTKLDRLARPVPDARDLVEELTGRGVRLELGGSVHDPTEPIGRLLFNVLAMVAEFEAALIKARTREGMAVRRAAGKLRGQHVRPDTTHFTGRPPRYIDLLVVDEADRLSPPAAREHLRDRFDRRPMGLLLIGMPGIDKRLSATPQLYSHIGFAHQ